MTLSIVHMRRMRHKESKWFVQITEQVSGARGHGHWLHMPLALTPYLLPTCSYKYFSCFNQWTCSNWNWYILCAQLMFIKWTDEWRMDYRVPEALVPGWYPGVGWLDTTEPSSTWPRILTLSSPPPNPPYQVFFPEWNMGPGMAWKVVWSGGIDPGATWLSRQSTRTGVHLEKQRKEGKWNHYAISHYD